LTAQQAVGWNKLSQELVQPKGYITERNTEVVGYDADVPGINFGIQPRNNVDIESSLNLLEDRKKGDLRVWSGLDTKLVVGGSKFSQELVRPKGYFAQRKPVIYDFDARATNVEIQPQVLINIDNADISPNLEDKKKDKRQFRSGLTAQQAVGWNKLSQELVQPKGYNTETNTEIVGYGADAPAINVGIQPQVIMNNVDIDSSLNLLEDQKKVDRRSRRAPTAKQLVGWNQMSHEIKLNKGKSNSGLASK
jgi:hypothetical protein